MDKIISIYIFKASDKNVFDELFDISLKNYLNERGIAFNKEAKVVKEPHQKPYLVGYDNIEFSISHSSDLWGCAFGASRVGFDIEKIRKCDFLLIARKFFNEKEYEYINENANLEAFFKVWTAKESYVKFKGEGITNQFRDFSVVEQDIKEKISDVYINMLSIQDGYEACLCCLKNHNIKINYQYK